MEVKALHILHGIEKLCPFMTYIWQDSLFPKTRFTGLTRRFQRLMSCPQQVSQTRYAGSPAEYNSLPFSVRGSSPNLANRRGFLPSVRLLQRPGTRRAEARENGNVREERRQSDRPVALEMDRQGTKAEKDQPLRVRTSHRHPKGEPVPDRGMRSRFSRVHPA